MKCPFKRTSVRPSDLRLDGTHQPLSNILMTVNSRNYDRSCWRIQDRVPRLVCGVSDHRGPSGSPRPLTPPSSPSSSCRIGELVGNDGAGFWHAAPCCPGGQSAGDGRLVCERLQLKNTRDGFQLQIRDKPRVRDV